MVYKYERAERNEPDEFIPERRARPLRITAGDVQYFRRGPARPRDVKRRKYPDIFFSRQADCRCSKSTIVRIVLCTLESSLNNKNI